MRSVTEIDTEKPEAVEEVLRPSLEDKDGISQEVESGEESIEIEIETEGIGQLRGCTDTVFRLGTLAKKIIER